MKKKRIVSFYQYMMHYPYKDPGRRALAANIKELAPQHPELKEIDSLADLMIYTAVLTDYEAREAVTGGLWCEYCTVTGHPLTGEE